MIVLGVTKCLVFGYYPGPTSIDSRKSIICKVQNIYSTIRVKS
jgi:hypothetical protein